MSRAKKAAAAPAALPVPLACVGRFLVLSKGEVQVHMLDAVAEASYWDGLQIAETRCRDAHQGRAYVMRQTFRCDAQLALPAPSFDSLAFYMEHYEGPGQDQVRTMAAVILSGQEFRTDQGGGQPAIPTGPAPAPSSPAPEYIDGERPSERAMRLASEQMRREKAGAL